MILNAGFTIILRRFAQFFRLKPIGSLAFDRSTSPRSASICSRKCEHAKIVQPLTIGAFGAPIQQDLDCLKNSFVEAERADWRVVESRPS